MEPDGERIADHREQRRRLSDVDSEADQEDERGSSTSNRGDFEPVHGETVVEARRAEVVEQTLIDVGGPAEDDRLDHVSSLAAQTRGRVAAQPATDAVADAGDASAPPDQPVRLTAQDCVDALPAQPLRLVEAVRRSRRSLQLAEEPEQRALRRRSPEWELEQGRLVHVKASPAKHERLHPLVEGSRPWPLPPPPPPPPGPPPPPTRRGRSGPRGRCCRPDPAACLPSPTR